MCRRAAKRAPPSLMLRMVPNSRNFFPCSSTSRTKAGIANGSRCQRRRWRVRPSLGTWTPAPRMPFKSRLTRPSDPSVLLGPAKLGVNPPPSKPEAKQTYWHPTFPLLTCATGLIFVLSVRPARQIHHYRICGVPVALSPPMTCPRRAVCKTPLRQAARQPVRHPGLGEARPDPGWSHRVLDQFWRVL
jgi:hypothetical protein